MKKLIVLLLAFAMVGAVSAQVTVATSLYGQVNVIDQAGNSQFVQWGGGWDTLTFKASSKDAKYGVSATISSFLDGSFLNGAAGTTVFRDWNFWWQGQYAKVIMGNLYNGDFRLTLPYWKKASLLGGTQRFTGWGMLIESVPVSGFSVGLNFAAPLAATQIVDVLKGSDFGLKYADQSFGTAIAQVNLTPANNIVNAGVKVTSVKDLVVSVLGQAKVDANIYTFNAGFQYTGVKNLMANLEAEYQLNNSLGGVNQWDVWAGATYNVTDKLSVQPNVYLQSMASVFGYDAWLDVDYAYGNGLTSEIGAGYDNYSVKGFHTNLTLYYAVSF